MILEKIKHVAVLGAGVMGHSLAQVFALKGYKVRLCDVNQSILHRSMKGIHSDLESLFEFGYLTQEAIQATLNHIEPTVNFSESLEKADQIGRASCRERV